MVECDASASGLGAVLMQDGHHIAYYSNTVFDRTLAKSAYELELMALVMAVQHWRPYLVGCKFVVRSDQRSLRFLLQQSVSTPAQHFWVAKL